MELIIGGAFQGQLDYGKANHPEIIWTDGAVCTPEDLYTAAGVYDFQEFIRSRLGREADMELLADQIYSHNPDLVLICDEVGCGVVPTDASDREYREAVGRACTRLAVHSEKVVRVICGIGTVIKGD